MSEPTSEHAPPNPPCPIQKFLFCTVTANPDTDASRPGTEVPFETMVTLSGKAMDFQQRFDCSIVETDIPLTFGVGGNATWSLFFNGSPVPPTISTPDRLPNDSTPTPSFLTARDGKYQAKLKILDATFGANQGIREVISASPGPVLLNSQGYITFLRAHDLMEGPHLRYPRLLPIFPCLCNVDFKAFITNCLISNSRLLVDF